MLRPGLGIRFEAQQAVVKRAAIRGAGPPPETGGHHGANQLQPELGAPPTPMPAINMIHRCSTEWTGH